MSKKSYFKVNSIIDLEKSKLGDIIPTSDFASLTPQGKFVQLEYIEEDAIECESIKVHPGVFTITKTVSGLRPLETEFSSDKILEEFLHTQEISDAVDCFFENLDVYKKFDPKEMPRRGALLYGPPGGGKTSSITKISNKYTKIGGTLTLLWDSNKFEAYQIKDLIKSFEYVGVDKMILVVEDIGGGELSDRKAGADSSLLSLLDNKEKTFGVPTFIIATTNHPENFMQALTDRYGRFDDKIKVGYPPAKARVALLEFFTQAFTEKSAPQDALDLIANDKCEKFPPSTIREVVLRAELRKKKYIDIINEIVTETKVYQKGFSEPGGKFGF